MKQSKIQFKLYIKEKLKIAALKELKDRQDSHSKVRDIVYCELKIKTYITSNKFTNIMVNILFNLERSMTRNIKANFSSLFKENIYVNKSAKKNI